MGGLQMNRVVIGKVNQENKTKTPTRQVIGAVSQNYINKQSKHIISSADLNNDNSVDMIDVIKAKKKTEASPSSTIKEINTQATQGIKDYFFTPKYDFDTAIKNGIEKSKKDKLTAEESSKIAEVLKRATEDKNLPEDEKKYYDSYREQFSNIAELKKKFDEAKESYEYSAKRKDRNYFKEIADNILLGPTGVKELKIKSDEAEKAYQKSKNSLYYSSLPNGEYKPLEKDDKNALTGFSKKQRKHAYINHNNLNLDDITKNATLKVAEAQDKSLSVYKNMTEREVGIYNYLYQNEGEEKAEEYLEHIEADLQERAKGKLVTDSQKMAEEHPWASAGLSVLTTPLSAAEQVKLSANYLITGEIERNTMSDVTSILRSGLPEQVDLEIGNFDAFDFVYNTTMSGIDSLAMAPLGAGGAAMLGLSAAASATNDIIDRGGTDSQAFWGGIAAGVFEGFFEKFSIGELDAMKDSVGSGFKVFAGNLAKSMLVNGSEETATEIANILYDYAANGGISQYATLVEEYKQQNPKSNEKAAREYAAKQLGLQILEAGASGALMGFGFGGIGSAFSHKNAVAIGKTVAANGMENQVLDLALKTDINSNAHKLADRILSSGKMRPAQIGSVVAETMQELTDKKKNIVSNAVFKRAVDLGISDSKARDFATQLSKVLSGEDVSHTVRKSLESEPAIKQITAELQMSDSNAWVAEMNLKLEEVENITSQVRNATKISQNPILQSSAEDELKTTNAVSHNLESYPQEKQNLIKSYLTSVNQKLKGLVQRVKSGDKTFERFKISDVSKRAASDIKQLLGIDIDGYTHNINTNGIQHILRRHGENGEYNTTMSNDNDIARIGWILENYDTVELLTKDGKQVYSSGFLDGEGNPAPQIRYIKKIDGTYYVVEAAFENNYKKMWVQTAYLQKTKEDVTQAAFADNNDQDTDAQSALVSPSSNNNISQDNDVVNNNISSNAENNSAFTEYSAKPPEPDAIKDTIFEAKGVQRLTYEQQKITDIGRRLGYKVKFGKMVSKNGVVENGLIDKTNRIIYINTEAKRPIQFIIKHELTHYLEINKDKYFDLANKIMDSDLFKKFYKSKGYNSISEYNSAIVELYSKYDKKFGEADANLEMVADFCAEYLFGGEESLDRFIQSFDAKERPAVIQAILDFIAYLKEKLSGNKEFNLDLVKLERKYMQLLKETAELSDSTATGVQHSFAKATDEGLISEAENMEKKGDSEKYIFEETGLIRDNGGVWVYEIDDSDMKFFKNGDAQIKDEPEYKELMRLERKKRKSEEDWERLADIDDKFLFKYGYGQPYLKNYIKHDKLFEKYPQLKDVKLEFKDLSNEDSKANYQPDTNKIVVDKNLLYEEDDYELRRALVHEIQHAIQVSDKREVGSSVEFWNARLLSGKRMPKNRITGKEMTPTEANANTAGEVEAIISSNRIDFGPNSRRYGFFPNFNRDKVVRRSEYDEDYDALFVDHNYVEALKNRDTESLQQMVDTMAMAQGYTERLYHQTDADFTEFNTENQKAGKYDFELPTGTFLKPSNEDIGLKGKKQMELYAKLQNPLEFRDREEARSFWEKNIEGYRQAADEVMNIDAEYRSKTDEAMSNVRSFMKEWKQNNPQANSREIYSDAEYQRLMDIQDSIVDEWEEKSNEASLKAKELINSFIAQNNYDGIVVEYDEDGANKSTKTYIVFDSSQLKDAAAVTYDDDGEVIPLSERFNSEQADIRHSLSAVTSAESLLESYENGDITREEYLAALNKQKTLNPVEISNLTEEDASTTPHHQRKRGKSDGDGTSKFYGSLLESSIFDDTFKDEVRDDSFIEKYKTISNKETMRKAANELDTGGQRYVNKWWNKEPDEASLIDTAVGFILMDRYQRVGDYESAAAAAEKVRAFGTASGQQVQIFSIIGRLDPNSMQAYSQLTLDKAFKKLADTKTQKWIDDNAEKYKLTEADIEFIRRHTLQAAMFDDNTRPKAVALGKICARIQDKIPPNIGRSFVAFKRDSMLLNLKTIIRNIQGNAGMILPFVASDFFGSIIDKKISKKTGVRTTGNFKLKGSGSAFKKGLYESWDDFKRGIRTRQEELNRFDMTVTAGKNFNEHHDGKMAKQLNAIAKTLNKIDNFTSFCLEAGDRPFFELWLTNSINNQKRLNNVDIPTPEMLEIARQEALQRTWQDDNMFSRSVAHLKKTFNNAHLSDFDYGFGDFVFDFVKTPTNIAKAIVEFSPAGFALAGNNARKIKIAISKGKLTPQLQKEYVRSLSNAITGTLIYTLVAIGASLGVVKLSGDEDDDKDASNYEKYIMGIPPYSIEFLGVNITYDWMQPFGSILAVVADFKENRKTNPEGDETNAIFEAIKAGGKVFARQSFIQSLYDLCSVEDWVEGIGTVMLAEPAKYIPQRWSQTASFLDEYRRTSYDSTNSFKSAINKVIAKIPGLRTTLPKQVNVLGEDVKNTQYLDVFEPFALPWNTYPKSSNEVVKEIYSLYKSTGENSVIPRTAPNYITVKGTKFEFTPEEKADFQRNIGTRSAKMLGQLFDDKEYNKLSDDEKVDVIKNIYQFAYDKAKSEREYNYKTLSAMVGEKKNGEPILTEERYNKLPSEARELLAQEFFLSKTEVKYIDNPERLIQYYIKQAKE